MYAAPFHDEMRAGEVLSKVPSFCREYEARTPDRLSARGTAGIEPPPRETMMDPLKEMIVSRGARSILGVWHARPSGRADFLSSAGCSDQDPAPQSGSAAGARAAGARTAGSNGGVDVRSALYARRSDVARGVCRKSAVRHRSPLLSPVIARRARRTGGRCRTCVARASRRSATRSNCRRTPPASTSSAFALAHSLPTRWF